MTSNNPLVPVITIQCDWNDVIRLPKEEAWISSKILNQTSVHDKLRTSVNMADKKIKIDFTDNYQYISHGNLNLVVKHIPSGLRVAFVAPTKVHNIHKKAVLSVAAAENSLAVSSCEEDKLLVWDSRTSEILLDLKGHGGPVYKCRFFPSGIVVLSSGADGSSRIWSAETGINPVTLKGHTMAITDVCIIDKGRNVITVGKDGTGKLWDVGQSNCLGNVLEGYGPINCCALATTEEVVPVENEREVGTGNKLLLVGCERGLIVCANVAKREVIYCKQFNSACNSCIVMDQTAIVGCADGKVFQMTVKEGTILKEWHESANPVLSITSLPNQLFIVGRQDGTCTVFSLYEAHSKIRVCLTGSDCDGIRDITFNGKWILTGCRDSNIRKYDFNQITVHYK
ncbi:proteasomal ATPase-associated factor 1-like [Ostrinia furnacalis]|uniref:proteasomal ATPase-associated factor 1-like n=1 Tax=Ostrinia furnacalis TaxID=93504 RepID=UPI001039789D|nr:proteasomal ATPase-associated factor 1-like [Ostrinia furnacalis]